MSFIVEKIALDVSGLSFRIAFELIKPLSLQFLIKFHCDLN